MHERSLVTALLRQVAATRDEQPGRSVMEVCVEIGPLAGVEPLLVESALSELAPLCGLAGAKLMMQHVQLTARCRSCGIVEVPQTRIACPECGSNAVCIVAGDGMFLKSVTVCDGAEMERL
jgi:hydrogenase nickel incorporation protein HypA/HybF